MKVPFMDLKALNASVNDEIQIEGISLPYNISFSDMRGNKIIIRNNIRNNKLNIKDLPSGIYILKVESGETRIFQKVLKLR